MFSVPPVADPPEPALALLPSSEAQPVSDTAAPVMRREAAQKAAPRQVSIGEKVVHFPHPFSLGVCSRWSHEQHAIVELPMLVPGYGQPGFGRMANAESVRQRRRDQRSAYQAR